MHGVVEWNSSNLVSNLVTWQDQRGTSTGKLSQIQKLKGCNNLKDGFGFTTLSILASENKLSEFEFCGTIHDYLVWILVGMPSKSFIDTTDAASWGLFNIETNRWNSESVHLLEIPESILPTIYNCGSKAGLLSQDMASKTGIPSGIPVMVAIGDNQASIIGTSTKPSADECFINIGTSTQLSVVASREKALSLSPSPTFEIRPFIDDTFLIVTAPLCGGRAWAFLKDVVKEWMHSLGMPEISDDIILYSKIDSLALNEIDSNDLPKIEPHFLGERWDETLRASFTNINLNNFTLGKVGAAMALGIVSNLKSNISEECFKDCKSIFVNGNAARKNKAMHRAIEKTFGISPSFKEGVEEAALGAAILAARLVE
ncbi:sedoheptulokinase isoform X3 [Histomonas meleagridis]|uniref:sedoheptulokinase isoform X3 n=1 Tax=Histomonas meleagridis TaxID=135588 RepID=UPI0035595CE7|nr:sedoheptulokinase isoform X3 [Histomonas meleagridis]KAH0796147.1 sedoheptulokinase isoform X3 [Histomonas meleagridis]